MVIEHRVKVIVMITELVEGGKKKADQYWPDKETKTIDLENNIKLQFLQSTYQGTYYQRLKENN